MHLPVLVECVGIPVSMMTGLRYCCALVAACLALTLSLSARSGANAEKIPQDVKDLLTEAEKTAVASVDGDPDFIVGVQGLAQPLCFRVEGEPGHVVRLLQDPESGVIVNARISRPVPGSKKTFLSAVLISRRNFRVVAKVGRVLVNRYRFEWGPVSVRLVHGHRVLIAPTLLALTLRNKNVTLVVKRHLPEGRRLANGTIISTGASPSAPNTAQNSTSSGNHGNAQTSGTTRRRGNRRRDDVDRGPRRRSRRLRRPGRRGNTQNINDDDNQPERTKRDVNFDITNSDDYISTIHSENLDEETNHRSFTRARRQTSSRDNSNSVSAGTATPSRSRTKSRSRSRPRSRSGGQGGARGSSQADGSSDGDAAVRVPPRELAAYMGFYVSDARDLSPETHGLLGQFLHKRVTLQKIRRKPNGVTKVRLLVATPRPHRVKAKQRTLTNLALNTSSTCWWLRGGGRGVVDGLYTDYLVPRFRHTDILPLPPGQIAQ